METKEKVIALIAENVAADVNSITEETTFDELGVDSLDMVEFVMEAEEEFGISIEQDEISSVKKVGDAVELIKRKIGV